MEANFGGPNGSPKWHPISLKDGFDSQGPPRERPRPAQRHPGSLWGLILYFVFGPLAITKSVRVIMESMKGIMQSMKGLMMGLIMFLLDSKWFGYFFGAPR